MSMYMANKSRSQSLGGWRCCYNCGNRFWEIIHILDGIALCQAGHRSHPYIFDKITGSAREPSMHIPPLQVLAVPKGNCPKNKVQPNTTKILCHRFRDQFPLETGLESDEHVAPSIVFLRWQVKQTSNISILLLKPLS